MPYDIVFRTGYDFMFGERGDIDFGDEPSLTIQSAKDECDINLIIERANAGMAPAFVNERVPQFGDFSEVADYQSAFNQVIEAQDQFAALPSKVRARFGNDPAQLLSFISDASNRDEAIRLGLISPPDVVPAGDGRAPQAPGDGVSPSVEPGAV